MLTGKMTGNLQRRSNNKELKKELELPFFNMDELACATNEFSVSNKLGEGGFGPVYKVMIIYIRPCKIWLLNFQGTDSRHQWSYVVLKLFHYRTYSLFLKHKGMSDWKDFSTDT